MERSLSYLLSQILNELFEDDFTDKNIQLGLWGGYISLEKLQLRRSLFDADRTPLSLAYGSIGKIEIKIPWNNFGNEAIQIVVDGVMLLFSPNYERDNMEAKMQREHRIKRAKLAAVDMFLNSQSKQSKHLGYTEYLMKYMIEKMAGSILKNISVSVRNIHVRYEDLVSCKREFSVGFTLESFTLNSVGGVTGDDDDDVTSSGAFLSGVGLGFLQDSLLSPLAQNDSRSVRQVCHVDSLAIYCNVLQPSVGSTDPTSEPFLSKSRSQILVAMRQSLPTRHRCLGSERQPRHQYLIKPFHTSACIDIMLGGAHVGDVQVGVQIATTEVAIQLDDTQLTTLVNLADSAMTFAAVDRFSAYRPARRPNEMPGAWWRFAIHAIRMQLGHFDRPKMTMRSIDDFFITKLVYTELWKRCVFTASTRIDPPSQRFSNSSLEVVRLQVLKASQERRLYRVAMYSSPGVPACTIPYTKPSPTAIALLSEIEERLSYEVVYFLRALAERELYLECRDRESQSGLFRQAKLALWGTVGSVRESEEQKVEAKLELALELLSPTTNVFQSSGRSRRRNLDVQQDPADNSSVLFRLRHQLERVCLTLSLSPSLRATLSTASHSATSIPFLSVVQEQLEVSLAADVHTAKSKTGDCVNMQVTLQDLQVLEMLPVADSSCSGSVAGGSRSQAMSVYSNFRRNKFRRIVSRYVVVSNTSRKANSTSPFLLDIASESDAILSPVLHIKVSIPLHPNAGTKLGSAIDINVHMDELEVYISPSLCGVAGALAAFTKVPVVDSQASELNEPKQRSTQENTNELNVKCCLDDCVDVISAFEFDGNVDVCLMPLHIVTSVNVDGNNSCMIRDDMGSVDSTCNREKDHIMVLLDTGMTVIKIGKRDRGSADISIGALSTAVSKSAVPIQVIEVLTSDVCLYLADYTGPCEWRSLDMSCVERGSIFDKFSIQTVIMVEKKLLETCYDPPQNGVEPSLVSTPITSVSVTLSELSLHLSEQKTIRILELVDAFLKFEEIDSGATLLPSCQDIFSGRNVFGEVDSPRLTERQLSFLDDDTRYFEVYSDTAECLPDNKIEAKPKDHFAFDYEDDDEGYFSVDEDFEQFPNRADDMMEDSTTINQLEVCISTLQDEISDLNTEHVALMAKMRILELNTSKKKELEVCSSRLALVETRLRDLRREYVEAMIELDSAKEASRKRQKDTSQLCDSVVSSYALKNGVNAFLKALGDNATKTEADIEKDKESVRAMYSTNKLMMAFNPVQRKPSIKITKKTWRSGTTALLSLVTHVPAVKVDILTSATIQNTTNNSYLFSADEEKVILVVVIDDIGFSATHKCNGCSVKSTVRDIKILNLLTPLTSSGVSEDKMLIFHTVSAATNTVSPRPYKTVNALRAHCDVIYGGNVYKSTEFRKSDSLKVSIAVAAIEVVAAQNILVSLGLCGVKLFRECAKCTELVGALTSSGRGRKSEVASPSVVQSIPSAAPLDNWDLTDFVSKQLNGLFVTFEVKYAGLTVLFPLLDNSTLSFSLCRAMAYMKCTSFELLYGLSIADIYLAHTSAESELTITLFGKELGVQQNVISITGSMTVPDNAVREERASMSMELYVDTCNLVSKICPATLVCLIDTVAEGSVVSFLAQMVTDEKPSAARSDSCQEEHPRKLTKDEPFDKDRLSYIMPLEFVEGLVSSCSFRAVVKCGSLSVVLPLDDTETPFDGGISLGFVAVDSCLAWGGADCFAGIESQLLVNGIHVSCASKPPYLVKPFYVACSAAVLHDYTRSDNLAPNLLTPRQDMLTDVTCSLIDEVDSNTVQMSVYVSPVNMYLSEDILNCFGKVAGSTKVYIDKCCSTAYALQNKFITSTRTNTVEEPGVIEERHSLQSNAARIILNGDIAIRMSSYSLFLGLSDIRKLSNEISPQEEPSGTPGSINVSRGNDEVCQPAPRLCSAIFEESSIHTNVSDCAGDSVRSLCRFTMKECHIAARTVFDKAPVVGDNYSTEEESSGPLGDISTGVLPVVNTLCTVGSMACCLVTDNESWNQGVFDFVGPLDYLVISPYCTSQDNECVLRSTMNLSAHGNLELNVDVSNIKCLCNADLILLLARLCHIYQRSAINAYSVAATSGKFDVAEEILTGQKEPSSIEGSPLQPSNSVASLHAVNDGLAIDESLEVLPQRISFVELRGVAFQLPKPLSGLSISVSIRSCGVWVPAGSNCRRLSSGIDTRAVYFGADMHITACHFPLELSLINEITVWTEGMNHYNTFWSTSVEMSSIGCYMSDDITSELGFSSQLPSGRNCDGNAPEFSRKNIISPCTISVLHCLYLQQDNRSSDSFCIHQDVDVRISKVHVSCFLDYRSLLDTYNTSFEPLQRIGTMMSDSKVEDSGDSSSSLDQRVSARDVGVQHESLPVEDNNECVAISSPGGAKSLSNYSTYCPDNFFELVAILHLVSRTVDFTISQEGVDLVLINDVMEQPMPVFKITAPIVSISGFVKRMFSSAGASSVGLCIDGSSRTGWEVPEQYCTEIPADNDNWLALVGCAANVSIECTGFSVAYNDNGNLSWVYLVYPFGGRMCASAPVLSSSEVSMVLCCSEQLLSTSKCTLDVSDTFEEILPVEDIPSNITVDVIFDKESVDIRLDQHFIEALNGINESMKYLSDAKTYKKQLAAYSLVNRSGIPLMYRCHGRAGGVSLRSAMSGMAHMPRFGSAPLPVGLFTSSGSRHISIFALFSPVAPPFQFCSEIDVTEPANYTYHVACSRPKNSIATSSLKKILALSPEKLTVGESDSDLVVCLPVEVRKLATGYREIIVRSTLCIKNHFFFSVEVQVVSDARGDEPVTAHLEEICPGQTAYIPADLCGGDNLSLKIKPARFNKPYSELDFVDIEVPSLSEIFGGKQPSLSRRGKCEHDEVVKIIRSDFRRIRSRAKFLNSDRWRLKTTLNQNEARSCVYSHWLRFPNVNQFSRLGESGDHPSTNLVNMHVAVESHGPLPLHSNSNLSGRNYLSRDVVIGAPVTLFNGLPSGVDILVFQGKPTRRAGVPATEEDIKSILKSCRSTILWIHSGEMIQCTDFHCAEDVTVCMRIHSVSLSDTSNMVSSRGHTSPVNSWSSMVLVRGSEPEADDSDTGPWVDDINTLSGNNALLTLKLSVTDKSGHRQIDIFAPFWVATYSAHNLHFQHHPDYDKDGVLNGTDDVCADQSIVPQSSTADSDFGGESIHPALLGSYGEHAGSSTTGVSSPNDMRVFSFSGERLREGHHLRQLSPSPMEYGNCSRSGARDEDDLGRPYRVMMCGLSVDDREDPRDRETHLRLRIEEFSWSKRFTVTPGQMNTSVTTVSAKSSSKNAGKSTASKLFGSVDPFGTPSISDQETEFVISTSVLKPPFQQTTLVVVRDKFVAVNMIGQAMCMRQFGCNTVYEADHTDEVSLSWRIDKPKLLQIRLAAHGWLWSGRLSVSSREAVTVLMRRGKEDESVFLIEINVVNKAGCTHIIFRAANFFSPYRIENRTRTALRFHQCGVPDNITVLRPFHACSYAWDEPTLSKLLYFEKNRSVPTSTRLGSSDWLPLGKFALDLPDGNKQGSIMIMLSGGSGRGGSTALEVRLDEAGPTRVLTVLEVVPSRVPSPRRSRQRFDTLPQSLPPTLALSRSASDSMSHRPCSIPSKVELSIALRRCGIFIYDQRKHSRALEQVLLLSFANITSTFSQRDGNSVVCISTSLDGVEVTGVTSSGSDVAMLYRVNDCDIPFLSVCLEVDTRLPHGIVSLPLLDIACAPVVINFDENVIRRLSSMTLLDAANVKEENMYGVDEYSRDRKRLASGYVKHNIAMVHAGNRTEEVSSMEAVAMSDAILTRELVNMQLSRPSMTPPVKLYVCNFTLSDISLVVTANANLICGPLDRNGGPGGIRAILRNIQTLAALFLRVWGQSVINCGKVPVHIGAIKVEKYFGGADGFAMAIANEYQSVALLQTTEFITSPSALASSASYITRYSTACALSTAGNIAELCQVILQSTGAVETDMKQSYDQNCGVDNDSSFVSDMTVNLVRSSTEKSCQTLVDYPKGFRDGIWKGVCGLVSAPVRGLNNGGVTGLFGGVARGVVGLGLKPTYGILSHFSSSMRHSTGLLLAGMKHPAFVRESVTPLLTTGNSVPDRSEISRAVHKITDEYIQEGRMSMEFSERCVYCSSCLVDGYDAVLVATDSHIALVDSRGANHRRGPTVSGIWRASTADLFAYEQLISFRPLDGARETPIQAEASVNLDLVQDSSEINHYDTYSGRDRTLVLTFIGEVEPSTVSCQVTYKSAEEMGRFVTHVLLPNAHCLLPRNFVGWK